MPIVIERLALRLPMIEAYRKLGTSVQAAICAICLMTAGCQIGQRPQLVDTLGSAIDDYHLGTWSDPRQLAPIIIVASVEENRIVSKHLEAARYRSVYLDLHIARCKLENSVKGGLRGSELSFFYFADGRYPSSKPNPRHKQYFQATPGMRYLFFLTRDNGVLRSIGDVGDYSIRVTTGRHPEGTASSEDVGRSISEILLTPGDTPEFSAMADRLLSYSFTADIWSSRLLNVHLLRHLTSLPEPIRSAACLVLVSNYYGQDDCLQGIMGDPLEEADKRQAARKAWDEYAGLRKRLFGELKDPAVLIFERTNADSRRRVREELETILMAPDQPLHERACIALRRYFPYDAEPACAERLERPARQ